MTLSLPGWYADPAQLHGLRYWDGVEWSDRVLDEGVEASDALEESCAPPVTPRDEDLSSVIRQRPEPALIRSPADAEGAAARWMRYWGYEDASVTGRGADGGVDVRSSDAVAQVKALQVPVGRPDLQRLHGVATSENKMGFFFSLMYFTPQAKEWADQVGIALFRFDLQGEPEPVNAAALAIVADIPDFASPADDEDDYEVLAVPLGIPDRAAVQIVRDMGNRTSENLVAFYGCWLPCFVYGVLADQRDTIDGLVRKHATRAIADSVVGASLSPSLLDEPRFPVDGAILPTRLGATEVRDLILGTWRECEPTDYDHEARAAQAWLHSLGVRLDALAISVGLSDEFLLPVFVGLLRRGDARRIAVVDGVTGNLRVDWSNAVTEYWSLYVPEVQESRTIELERV
jgi:hypothetical protein